MARAQGSANFAGSLEVLAGAPIDARLVVNTKTDLTDPTSYSYKYIGMIVSVKDEGNAYILTADDTTDLANWKLIGSGGGGSSVQSDWNQTDTEALDYIKNKPTLGSAAAKDSTNTVTQGSTNLVEAGAVYNYINTQIVNALNTPY